MVASYPITYIRNMLFGHCPYNPGDKYNEQNDGPFRIWHYFHTLIVCRHLYNYPRYTHQNKHNHRQRNILVLPRLR